MKVLKAILLVLAILVGIFLLAGLFYPKTLTVEKERRIDASVGTVRQHLTEFRRYEVWWPWTRGGEDVAFRYEGPMGEKGSRMEWDGSTEMGSGEVTLEKSGDPIVLRIHFKKPHESEIRSRFSLKEGEDGTVKLRWSMREELSWPTNAIPHVMNVDERLGSHFEKGLERLAEAVEGEG
jgi:uncharacterized protein YndB with AHSA1/START domain